MRYLFYFILAVVTPGHLRAQKAADFNSNKDPDLIIENTSVSGHRYQADKSRIVTISFKITNHSSVDIQKPFRTSIKFMNGNRWKSGHIIKTKGLEAGKPVYVSYTIQKAPHKFDILINADFDNVVKESDESNNSIKTYFENPTPPVDRWISIGPESVTIPGKLDLGWGAATGLLAHMVINPVSTKTVYVAGSSCGIWKKVGTGNWFPLTDNITLKVSAIALAPDNPERIYCLTQNEGVYRSDDGGFSWAQISNLDMNAVVPSGKLLISKRDPNLMFAKSESGLYRSVDGGFNWSIVKPGKCTGIELNNETNIIYTAISSISSNDDAGIWMSYDQGDNWLKMFGCPGGALPSTTINYTILLAYSGSTLFAAFRTKNEFQIYRTTSQACVVGSQREPAWEKAWSYIGENDFWGSMWANPYITNNLYLGGTDFWRSTNKGKTFSRVGTQSGPPKSPHVDHHGFAAMPGSPNTIFSLNDGGIYGSTQNGNPGSWIFLGKGISNILFFDMADSYTKPNLVIGGTQDNGTIKTDGSLTWKGIRGGDGGTVDIDIGAAKVMYSMIQYPGSIAKSKNNGDDWPIALTGVPDNSDCFNSKFQLHPYDMNILVAPCISLWKIDQTQGTWQIIFTPGTGKVISTSIVPRPDLYLAGTDDGILSAGEYGNDFHEVFKHPSSKKIIDIEYDPVNTLNIYLSTDAANAGRIYLLRYQQTGLYDSIDITSDIPIGKMIQCIAVDPTKPYTIYAGHINGVLKGISNDNGLSWQWAPYMDGLPFADVRDLEIHPVTGVMRAATWGRSMFEVLTSDPIGSLLYIKGKINSLKVNDAKSNFGPRKDSLDADYIIQLDTDPGKYFGLKMGSGTTKISQEGQLKLLQNAFESKQPVKIGYIKNSIYSGRIISVSY